MNENPNVKIAADLIVEKHANPLLNAPSRYPVGLADDMAMTLDRAGLLVHPLDMKARAALKAIAAEANDPRAWRRVFADAWHIGQQIARVESPGPRWEVREAIALPGAFLVADTNGGGNVTLSGNGGPLTREQADVLAAALNGMEPKR